MPGPLALLFVLAAPPGAMPSPAPCAEIGGPADAARIDQARAAMKPPIREARLGPWRLVTDVPARELKSFDSVASHLAEACSDRTGLATAPGPDQVVVIFASDASYRAFAAADRGRLPGTRGHAGGSLAALAMGRTLLETRVLLVHELNANALAAALGLDVPGLERAFRTSLR